MTDGAVKRILLLTYYNEDLEVVMESSHVSVCEYSEVLVLPRMVGSVCIKRSFLRNGVGRGSEGGWGPGTPVRRSIEGTEHGRRRRVIG